MSTYILAHSTALDKTIAIIDRSSTLQSVAFDADGRPYGVYSVQQPLNGFTTIKGISVEALQTDRPDVVAYRLADGTYIAGAAVLFEQAEDCIETRFGRCRNVPIASLRHYRSMRELMGR